MNTTQIIGTPFTTQELDTVEALADLGPITVAANTPPWASIRDALPNVRRVIDASDVSLDHLDTIVAAEPDSTSVVVGIGGGTALDTAKYIAMRTGKRLILVPTVMSVDAGFTNAVGVRVDGHVRYIGPVVPELVILDLPLICSAPERLNRAGVGDILSCHTGLFDWELARQMDIGHAWREDLADLAGVLLAELDAASDDIGRVTHDGVRFLADAYRRIGAACAQAGHSRFEEGSEHFWAYNYEKITGTQQHHGELIALAVVAMSYIQANDPDWALDVVRAAKTFAHPADLRISQSQFVDALISLPAYARAEKLDYSIASHIPIDHGLAEEAWAFVQKIPRAVTTAPS